MGAPVARAPHRPRARRGITDALSSDTIADEIKGPGSLAIEPGSAAIVRVSFAHTAARARFAAKFKRSTALWRTEATTMIKRPRRPFVTAHVIIEIALWSDSMAALGPSLQRMP
jgi:hypothetical protein